MSVTQVALAGLGQVQENVERVAQRLARTDVSSEGTSAGDVVDLSAEMVALASAKHEYAALAKAIETDQEISQRIIDLLG